MKKNKIEKILKAEEIKNTPLKEEMESSYLDYAMSVIVSRALPDVRDGLKPVQRRILYAMYEMNLSHTAKFRKSAAITGTTLARFHPHGDISVYEAMVRMAQDFSLRYPLVEGQGNFGCFTKDTKVKLCDGRSLSFEELIKEGKEGKKHWTFTFNPETKEIEAAEIKNPRLTRKNEKIIEVTLDNEEKIKSTLDHRFMLRNEVYKQAKDLEPGDSLMPLYTKLYNGEDKNLKGCEIVYQPIENALNYFGSFKEMLVESRRFNHKIVKVRVLKKREDVYDLTVEPWHNFALGVGIFVHNSIDDDPPAAARYTEAKLSQIGEETLTDLEKETVPFLPNYDGTLKEPSVLPASIPGLLLNGSSGIAVGMATNVPPHNLLEICDALVYLIDQPEAEIDEIFQFVKGPDFPTGGIIYNLKQIKEAYATGKGAIVVRAKTEIEKEEKGEKIIIREIPYQVNKSELLIKIADLVKNKNLEGIRDIRDESTKEGIRIVIELKRDVGAEKILNQLFKSTNLQMNFNFNFVALEDGIQPRLFGFRDLLIKYLDWRREVVRKRTEFDLRKARERIHILDGFLIALLHIDEVVSLIRKSKDRKEAKEGLIKKFKLSEVQAEAILEMRLHQLAGLERLEIETEAKEKKKLEKELKALLENPKKILERIKEELKILKEKYPEKRRTQLEEKEVEILKEEDLIIDKPVLIALTGDGYIKRLSPEAFRTQARGGKGVAGFEIKEEDKIKNLLFTTLHAQILFFTSKGKVFSLKAYEIPETSREAKGKSLVNFLSLGLDEEVLEVVSVKSILEFPYLIMVTKNGMIKKIAAKFLLNIRKSGLSIINLGKGDLFKEASFLSEGDEIILVTEKGQAIRFKEKDLRAMGRGAAGVKGVSLKEGDYCIGLLIIKKDKIKGTEILVVTENGFGKATPSKNYRLQRRGGSGLKTAKITSKTGKIVVSLAFEDEEKKEKDLLLISGLGVVLRLSLSQVPQMSRQTQGVRLMRFKKEEDKIASVVII